MSAEFPHNVMHSVMHNVCIVFPPPPLFLEMCEHNHNSLASLPRRGPQMGLSSAPEDASRQCMRLHFAWKNKHILLMISDTVLHGLQ